MNRPVRLQLSRAKGFNLSSKCGGVDCQEPEIEACEHCGSVADQCDWQITNDNHGGNAPCGIQWSEVIE
jgi:hypothetical protein